MKPLVAALRFLTVLPLPARWPTTAEDLGRSLPFFPLVGALIGAAAAGLSLGAAWALPPWPAAVVVAAGGVLFSGGLHLDGLSDSADGLLSSRPRERALEIMRDGRAGPMGVFAVVCVMALKISALAYLVPLKDGSTLWRAAFLMPVAGRAAILVSMSLLPYARPAGGLGSAFYAGARRASAVWALIFLVLFAAIIVVSVKKFRSENQNEN